MPVPVKAVPEEFVIVNEVTCAAVLKIPITFAVPCPPLVLPQLEVTEIVVNPVDLQFVKVTAYEVAVAKGTVCPNAKEVAPVEFNEPDDDEVAKVFE